MSWITKIPGVSKAMDKAVDKFKSFRRGQDKDREVETEADQKQQPAQKQEIKEPENTPRAHKETEAHKEVNQELEKLKGGLEQITPGEVDGGKDALTPAPTPDTGTDGGGSAPLRGRAPWDESYYQESDLDNSPDMGDPGMDEEGIDL